MRVSVGCAAILVVHLMFLLAACGDSRSVKLSPDDIVAADQMRAKAVEERNLQHLDSVYSEATLVHATGRLEAGPDYVGRIRDGHLNVLTIAELDIQGRIFGQTAVVTGTREMRVLLAGNEQSFLYRFTSVYAIQADGLQLVVWHATGLADD